MQNKALLATEGDLTLQPVEIKLTLQPRGSIAARLRPVWPTIIEAIEQGVTASEIRERLEEAGLKVAKRTFESELYRYRQSLKAGSE